MLKPSDFYNFLNKKEINFLSGVPDSLLKDFCAYVTDNVSSKNNIICANEGNAVALATGYHLATGKIGLVYMQNSGQGNSVNPLISLTDTEVYSIPLLLIIGWRGEPGEKDEPQHIKQGKITLDLLDTLRIPYQILPDSPEKAEEAIDKAIDFMRINNAPYALVVRKNTFEPYSLQNKKENSYELSREKAIKLVVDQLDERDVIISTTGKISRELFEYRKELNQKHNKDFLTVGSMGHSSQIALGIALLKPDKSIFCFDGDGALIMHMGGLAIIGQKSPENFKHVVFNNGAHDSVGGQPTVGFEINILEIAKACGYEFVLRAETEREIKENMQILKEKKGPGLLEIRVNKGARNDLGRPTTTPIENKKDFIEFLKD